MGVQFNPTDNGAKRRAAAGKTAAAIMFVLTAESGTAFDATTLAEHSALFDKWVGGIAYKAGQIRLDNIDGGMYRCIEDHDAASAKKPPSKTPTLWRLVCRPDNEWPEWFPYIGRTDAWMKGDKCSHDGKRWKNTEDYNVREPGVGGWDEVE